MFTAVECVGFLTAALKDVRYVNKLAQVADIAGDVKAKAVAEALDLIPTQYLNRVLKAFDGAPEAETLISDLIVYRHWGGTTSELGSPWFSLKKFSPEDARAYLALPNGNTATNVTAFRIPAGNKIVKGKVASQVGVDGFGDYAIGGEIQIYLPDPSVAQVIRN